MSSTTESDVLIVGAGPAGCAAALELAAERVSVVLLEKSSFPRHKVCGEFLSPEVAAVLGELGCGQVLAQAVPIQSGRVVTPSGSILDFAFSTPAYGLSRYRLDQALALRARAAGARLEEKTEVARFQDGKLVGRDGRRFAGRVVLLACGRHSLLNPSPVGSRDCFGFKIHFRGAWPARLDLHFFPGGYVGVAPVEKGRINVCGLVEKRLVSDPGPVIQTVLGKEMAKWRKDTEFFFCGPLRPGWQAQARVNQATMLPVGDAAAFVDPFTGDGISLALRSGRLAARHALALLKGRPARQVVAGYNRELSGLCGRQMAAARLVRLGSGIPLLELPLARLLAASPGLRGILFGITRAGLVASGPLG